MRLIAHNVLCCNVKTCRSKEIGLALAIETSKVTERDYDQDNVVRMMDMLNWAFLASVAQALGETMFPESVTEDLKQNEEFLRRLHRMLFEFEVVEGKLTCPNCSRVYPISNGIVNITMFDGEL